MSSKNHIQQELTECGSKLPFPAVQLFEVPDGYFENLLPAFLEMMRVKSDNTIEELGQLSPYIAGLSKQLPYYLPEGYFERAISIPVSEVSAQDELAGLSPLLHGMSKQMPYHVPDKYFAVDEQEHPAKVVSMKTSNWKRWLAAASVILVLTVSVLMVKKNTSLEGMSLAKYEKRVNKELHKMSDQELNDFLQYSDANMNGEEKAGVNTGNEIKEMLKDVPESDLREFLEETSDAGSNSMMN